MNLKKIEILNKQGEKLAAKLQLPTSQKVLQYALFAHCFTCNKNLTAIKHITRALNQSGIGVLTFDFTGLGDSEGSFEETNFSSNIEDLISVSDYLKDNLKAPELIIGHSLGGAAAIVASSRIDSIKAVATIGAPSSTTHVSHLFSEDIEKIKSNGVAEVSIGNRPFTVKKQFLKDIESNNLKNILSKNSKPILILHSPIDETVGINNAAELYQTAHHPKSFISLDTANHLLTDSADSLYAGQMIANWATRYIDTTTDEKISSNQQVAIRLQHDGGFTTEIKSGNHFLLADEPESVGGNNLGPSPYDLVLSGLGACTAMTLKMYADRKKWDLGEINIELNHSKDYAKDCETCENGNSKIDIIEKVIYISGDLDEKQKARLLEIADKCPVHKTLHSEVKVETRLVEP